MGIKDDSSKDEQKIAFLWALLASYLPEGNLLLLLFIIII